MHYFLRCMWVYVLDASAEQEYNRRRMNAESIKSTPLCDKHVALGAKMVPFAGWNMPVQYTGIIDEHNTVRSACGVFDISHMGQFLVSGEGATEWLNTMFTNNLNKLVGGMGQYSIMPLENEAPNSTPIAATATAPV